MAKPEITVVVPTRERPESLARCLTALDAQTVDSIEVIVVDDGRPGNEAVERAVGRSSARRLLRSPRPGAAAARNAGAAAARAPLVLFTDDDCVPHPGWAAAVAGALREHAAAAGTTLTASPGDRLAVASQHVADYLTTSSLDSARRIRFAASSNLGCRTEVLRALPFDEGYPASGGEDRDWCARLIEAGHELSFVPDALVTHHQQLDMGSFWRKHTGYGRGARIFRRRHGAADTDGVRGFHLRLVGSAFRRDPVVGGLVCLAQVATAAGFARQALTEPRQGTA